MGVESDPSFKIVLEDGTTIVVGSDELEAATKDNPKAIVIDTRVNDIESPTGEPTLASRNQRLQEDDRS